jgi:hypothetical protein
MQFGYRMEGERSFSDRWHWPIFTFGHVWQLPISGRIVPIDRSPSISFGFLFDFPLLLSLRSISRPKNGQNRPDGGRIDWFPTEEIPMNSSDLKQNFISIDSATTAAAFIPFRREFQWPEWMGLSKLRHPSGCYGWFGLAEENWTGRKVWEIVAFPCDRKGTKSRDFLEQRMFSLRRKWSSQRLMKHSSRVTFRVFKLRARLNFEIWNEIWMNGLNFLWI